MVTSPPKKTPLSEVVLADDSEQGFGVAALPARLLRYHRAHQRALHMSNYARDRSEGKLADKLSHCGHWLKFRHYYTVDQLRLHAADFCKKHLLCPFCAMRRAAKYLRAYLEKLEVVQRDHAGLKAYMVTLTVKDGEDLAERFTHLRGSMKRLSQARRDHLKAPSKNRHVEFAKAVGGVHSIEFKRGQGSGLWHPHVHMVWLCHEAPDARKLSQEWHAITGDSFIVDVTEFYDQSDVTKGFIEVFKYALKFSDMPLSDNWDAFRILSGKRLVDSFGLLRGVQVDEDLTDGVLDDLPYYEMLYRYQESGYSLYRYTERSDPPPPIEDPQTPQTDHPDLEERPMYTVTLSSLELHRYGDYVGWGPVSSTTGEVGRLVTFDTLEQAQKWIDDRPVFARDAHPTPHHPVA